MLLNELNQRLSNLINRFCTRVRCCLGISSSGSSSLVLNQKGEWINPASGTAWSLDGNAGTDPSTNFIGTTDDADIVFKRNNIYSGSFSPNNLVLGEAVNPEATGLSHNVWIGQGCGDVDINDSTFIGFNAGAGAQYSDRSTFVGHVAGFDATNCPDSTFIGYQSGTDGGTRRDISNAVSIGANSKTRTYSTAVGYNASANAENCVALGADAVADIDHMMAISDDIFLIKLRGVIYTWPAADGLAGQQLTTDGSGNLSWT